jgi:chromosome segregation ATPase
LFEAFVARTRAVLEQHIIEARRIVDNLNLEKTAAANALAALKDQCRQAKADVDAILAHRDKAASLGSIDAEISKARKEAERLKAENAKAAQDLEARLKQCTEADTRLIGLQNEARRFTAMRSEAEAAVSHIRRQIGV